MIQQIDNCIQYFSNLILNDLIKERHIICWVAGGAVRDYFSFGYVKCDVDLFFPNRYNICLALMFFRKNGAKFIFKNSKVISFKYKNKKFDLVKVLFLNPLDTIKSFDFTVCCAAVNDKDIVHHQTFFIDLSKMTLVVNSLPFPLSTMQRLQRYIKKGYTICNGGLLEIARAINKVDFKNKEQNTFEFYPNGDLRFIRYD